MLPGLPVTLAPSRVAAQGIVNFDSLTSVGVLVGNFATLEATPRTGSAT
jgi:hypothetical protein